MSKSLDISDSGRVGVAVVGLDGYVDLSTASKLENHLDKLIRKGNVRIAVDCSKLSYISSVGIGVLVGSVDELKENGGGIVLFAVSNEVRETLGLVSLESLVSIFDTRDEACASFSLNRS